MKRFNITTTCIEEDHYMVDISDKLKKIAQMIDEGMYFTINRARQYGKTTTLSRLFLTMQDKYIVILGSLEDFGNESYQSEQAFAHAFLFMIKNIVKFQDEELAEFVGTLNSVRNFQELSAGITEICIRSNKEIVLMLDESDKSSTHLVFIDFLAILRDKYNKRKLKIDKTFKSVILAGVHDVKNLKMHFEDRRFLTAEESNFLDKTTYNSPWNVAEDFVIDMSFDQKEILSMVTDYENDNHTGMNTNEVSEKIYNYTSGYPFLVSKLCKVIDERLDKDFSINGIQKAIKIIINEKGTLFDDLIKNLNNNQELFRTVFDIIVEGKEKTFNAYTYEKGLMYGIFKQSNDSKLLIQNKIFEKLIYEYMITMKEEEKGEVLKYEYRTDFIDEKGDLRIETILEKFQLLMKQEYRKSDEKFIEREGRLLFLCFIRPIINGKGFYFVEPQTRQDNRMDVVITYNMKQYIIELKIWHGKTHKEKGLTQLANYLDSQNEETGYIVLYSFNKNKKYTRVWSKINDRKIFEVIV